MSPLIHLFSRGCQGGVAFISQTRLQWESWALQLSSSCWSSGPPRPAEPATGQSRCRTPPWWCWRKTSPWTSRFLRPIWFLEELLENVRKMVSFYSNRKPDRRVARTLTFRSRVTFWSCIYVLVLRMWTGTSRPNHLQRTLGNVVPCGLHAQASSAPAGRLTQTSLRTSGKGIPRLAQDDVADDVNLRWNVKNGKQKQGFPLLLTKGPLVFDLEDVWLSCWSSLMPLSGGSRNILMWFIVYIYSLIGSEPNISSSYMPHNKSFLFIT